MKKHHILTKLFMSTLYLSAFTFGGGYVIITLMRKKFVDELHWIEEQEMLDLVAIAQSCPGPIAVNGAIVIGYKLAGILGVIVSVIGTIIPPFTIISVVSIGYEAFKNNTLIASLLEGMQAGIGAVICSVVFEMASGILKENNKIYLLLMLVAFIANVLFKINVIFIMLSFILFGLIYSTYQERRTNL